MNLVRSIRTAWKLQMAECFAALVPSTSWAAPGHVRPSPESIFAMPTSWLPPPRRRAGVAELLSSQYSHYCWSSRAIRRSAFFVRKRSGLHQGPSKIVHPVARRTSRRAVTHTAGCSALPAWVRLRVHVTVRRRRARYRLLRSAKPKTARPASHAAAGLGRGPSLGQLRSFSCDAPTAAQLRRAGRVVAA